MKPSILFAKWVDGMKEDWVLHLHTSSKVIALLLDLMTTSREIASMAELDDLTVIMTDRAARSFLVTSIYSLIDKRMEIILVTRPFEVLKIASDHNLPELARRAIRRMSSTTIWDQCGTASKREEYLASLRPEWELQFYRMLLQTSTKSYRKLEAEIRSVVRLDADVFTFPDEECGDESAVTFETPVDSKPSLVTQQATGVSDKQ